MSVALTLDELAGLLPVETSTLLMFAFAVLPLVCTPGPDLLFIASQAVTGGHRSAMRANLGVISGYVAHAILGALGVAAVVSASPILFEALRWAGIAYLTFLSVQIFRSAFKPASGTTDTPRSQPASLLKGFLTSFLNPKGLLVYFTILPAFMAPGGEDVLKQSIALSAVFIGLCALFYGAIGLVIASMGSVHGNDRFRRYAECLAGGLLLFAAVRMASR